jgi:septal ring factor EnvC (AmiA/AmiB activator)
MLWTKHGGSAPLLRYPTYPGAIIRAACAGRIASIERVRGKGKVVRIDHGGGLVTVSTDFQRVYVAVGQKVPRGAILGRADGPMFFEVMDGNHDVDPRPWMNIAVTRP